jgi:hypothetical protein
MTPEEIIAQVKPRARNNFKTAPGGGSAPLWGSFPLTGFFLGLKYTKRLVYF